MTKGQHVKMVEMLLFFVKMVGKLQMKLLGGKQFFLGKMVWFGSKVTCFPYLTDWWLNLIIIIVSKR
jgi:hypothetical protein